MQKRSILEEVHSLQFVPVTSVLSPILIGMALAVFPMVQKPGAGFEMFHLASLLSILISLSGMVVFHFEVRYGLRRPAWLWPLLLIAGLVVAAVCRVYGDIYIAFGGRFA